MRARSALKEAGLSIRHLHLHTIKPFDAKALLDQKIIENEPSGAWTSEITDKVTGEVRTSCNDPISFQWISPMALAVNIGVGWVGCVIGGLRTKPDHNNPPASGDQ